MCMHNKALSYQCIYYKYIFVTFYLIIYILAKEEYR